MPELLAIYGAFSGSAGLLSLGLQAWTRRQDAKTKLVVEASYVRRTIRPDDADYEFADFDPSHEEFARTHGWDKPDRDEGLTHIEVVNRGSHPVWISGYGMIQAATNGICAAWIGPTELGAGRTYRDADIADWYSMGEQGMNLEDYPIMVYVDLDDGTVVYSKEIQLRPHGIDHKKYAITRETYNPS
jgi:hypothetical protein